MEKKNNLCFYEEGRSVPQEAQKSFNNGRFSGTDINPMWRIKKLTDMFGPAGIGWYTEVVSRDIKQASDGTQCAFIGLNLYIKVDGEWSKPIYGEGGNTFEAKTSKGYVSVSDEAFKMAYTDALGIAAKALGIGADIWFANDKVHATKYDRQTEANTDAKNNAEKNAMLASYVAKMNAAKTNEEVMSLWKSLTDEQQKMPEYKEPCVKKCNELKAA